MTAKIDSMQNTKDSNAQFITSKFSIYNQDCTKGLKTLQDNSIDCIITDPPYFIDGMGSEWNDTNLKTKASKSGVIGGLPVGMKFDKAQGERLQEKRGPSGPLLLIFFQQVLFGKR